MRLFPTSGNGKVTACKRLGKASALFLFAFPAFVALALLAINAEILHEAKTTQQNAADAAVLAAAQTLVDDRFLVGPRLSTGSLFHDVRIEAQKYTRVNPTMGKCVCVDANYNNKPNGDIVIGMWTGNWLQAGELTDPFFACSVNGVRVMLVRTRKRCNAVPLLGASFLPFCSVNMITPATAIFDRRIYGFRPVGKVNIPLVPIALLSDPSRTHPHCWESQVEHGGCLGNSGKKSKGSDAWKFHKPSKTFFSGADGLYEMKVNFGGGPSGKSKGQKKRINACVLQIGAHSMNDVCFQVLKGIRQEHLGGVFQGKLVLNRKGHLIVPGTPFFSDTAALRKCLKSLKSTGEPRIWPLFAGYNSEGKPVIRGFVAARVVQVLRSGRPGVSFLLQPTMISTTTALTAASQPVNRYVGRVRLVQ